MFFNAKKMIGPALMLALFVSGCTKESDDLLNIFVFPNPVSKYARVAFAPQFSGAYGLFMVDEGGTLVYGREINFGGNGFQNVSIDLTDEKAGTYTVIIYDQNGELLASKKFSKI